MHSTSLDAVFPETCVSAAVAAPSIHNTQPWSFRLDAESATFQVGAGPVRRGEAAEHHPNTPDRPAVRPTDRGVARVVLRHGQDRRPLILGPRLAQGGRTQYRCTR